MVRFYNSHGGQQVWVIATSIFSVPVISCTSNIITVIFNLRFISSDLPVLNGTSQELPAGPKAGENEVTDGSFGAILLVASDSLVIIVERVAEAELALGKQYVCNWGQVVGRKRGFWMQVTGGSMYIGSPIWSGAKLDKSDQRQGRTMESTLTGRIYFQSFTTHALGHIETDPGQPCCHPDPSMHCVCFILAGYPQI